MERQGEAPEGMPEAPEENFYREHPLALRYAHFSDAGPRKPRPRRRMTRSSAIPEQEEIDS